MVNLFLLFSLLILNQNLHILQILDMVRNLCFLMFLLLANTLMHNGAAFIIKISNGYISLLSNIVPADVNNIRGSRFFCVLFTDQLYLRSVTRY